MKKLIMAAGVIGLLYACGDGNQAGGPDVTLNTMEDSSYYAVGASIVQGLPVEGIEFKPAAFQKGLNDQVSGEVTMNDMQVGDYIQGFIQELRGRGQEPVTADNPLTSDMDSISYAYGAYFARNLQDMNLDVRPDYIAAGFADAVAGTRKWESDEIQERLLQDFSTKAQQKAMEAAQAQVGPNKAEGQAFMEENKTKEGVMEHESGMQYKVLKSGPGTGESPTVQDRVTIHYEGRLLDGTVFDSSIQRGEPVTFALGQLVLGWQIAVPMMKPGDKWRIWLPSDLAYGDPGNPPVIPPGATLEFDIEYFGKADAPTPPVPNQ